MIPLFQFCACMYLSLPIFFLHIHFCERFLCCEYQHRRRWNSNSYLVNQIMKDEVYLTAFSRVLSRRISDKLYHGGSRLGPVNIYGNTGPDNSKRVHELFLSLSWTGPPVILKCDSTGPRLISMYDFIAAKDYFGVLRYGVMDYILFSPLFLIVEVRDHGNNGRFQKLHLTSYCREKGNIRIKPCCDWLTSHHLCYFDLFIQFLK